MRRNGGIIGPRQSPTYTDAKGIWDTHDQNIYRRTGAFPRIGSIGNVTLNGSTSPQSISEGASLTFVASTSGIPDGQTLDWQVLNVSGVITSTDFTGTLANLGGTVAVSNNSATVTGGLAIQGGTENDAFRVQFKPSNSGQDWSLGNSPVCTIVDVAAVNELYTLLNSSTPSGLTFTSGSGLSTGWSTSYGFQTGGNASGFSTPLSRTASLSYNSDWLLQVTTRAYSSCWDPALQIWQSAYGRTRPSWGWSTTNSTCVSFQCNCTSYTMLNTPQGGANSNGISYSSGRYYTHHLWWIPSLSSIRAKLTIGSNDSNATGTLACNKTSRSFSSYNSSNCYVGLASDYDGASAGSTSTNFTYFRIREFVGGYNTNSTSLPVW